MVKIKELENYYEKSFKAIIDDGDIVKIADTIDGAWEDYSKWEHSYDDTENNATEYLNAVKDKFYEWVRNCNGSDLLDYDIETYQRHFMLEDGKVYYLNSYL